MQQRQRLLDAVAEQQSVGQPGQRIVGGLVHQPAFELLARGDVLDLLDEVGRSPVLITDQRAPQLHPHGVPVAVQVALLDPVAGAQARADLGDRRQILGEVVGMGEVLEADGEQVPGRVARQGRERRVDAPEAAVEPTIAIPMGASVNASRNICSVRASSAALRRASSRAMT